MKIYTKYNFHKYTFCLFKEVSSAEIVHLKTSFTSKSGSSYLFTEEGVYRKSNHWGRAANCKWRLQSTISESTSRTRIGFAKWTEFQPINEIEKLYYIEVDFNENKVQYNHKSNSADATVYLRNATNAEKRVKEIRRLFENNKKLQYWESSLTFEELLKVVVTHLINTELTLLEIKNLIPQSSS